MAVIRINEIIDRLVSYHPQADTALVQKAYVWSAKLHAGSLRESGLPYLSHPLEVAGILTEMELHESSIAAGLLHDVVEDSSITLPELEAEFPKEIVRLVDGVTKIGKIPTEDSRIEVQAENFRKIILAMARDVRVILIKLADRLHNMQTLEHLSGEKKSRIARETMDIYAPIAGRLGIHWILAQLEDLSFQHLKPEIFFRLASQMAKIREARQDYIEKTQQFFKDNLEEAGIQAQVTGRFKHLYSIYRKMEKQNLSFDEVYDLIAFRIIVGTIPDCYDALRVIHSIRSPVPGRIKDYIALPKTNMYRSLHTTVLGASGEREEIQLRTPEMHAVAEYGIAAHWRYKQTGGIPESPETDEKTQMFLNNLVELHEELKDPYHFLESIKSEVLPDLIAVFTPDGDIVELPSGATPIDMAYSIHSDIGNHCAGAKVDGRIVPLNHNLKSGDTVEILTSNTVEPNRAWLEFVKSPRARNKINHWLSTKETQRNRELGRQVLESELLRYGKNMGALAKDGTLERVAERFNFSSQNRLLEALGVNRFPLRKVLAQIVPPEDLKTETKKAASPEKKKAANPGAESEEEHESEEEEAAAETRPYVTIASFNDPGFTFASCCSPLAGEAVKALEKEDGTMEVHRAECSRLLEETPGNNVYPARWDQQVEGENMITLEVVSEDRRGLLAELSSILSEENINIERALVRTTEEKKAMHTFRINMKNVSQLNRLINSMEKVNSVISVRKQAEARRGM
ncbi:MAG: bifunctional (p)ppGpp synthetase/guanosine-3',5'-bis(diphosphate) 3'-pyrophosphohydrolase [bacterium]